jgi:hypothetical protein
VDQNSKIFDLPFEISRSSEDSSAGQSQISARPLNKTVVNDLLHDCRTVDFGTGTHKIDQKLNFFSGHRRFLGADTLRVSERQSISWVDSS